MRRPLKLRAEYQVGPTHDQYACDFSKHMRDPEIDEKIATLGIGLLQYLIMCMNYYDNASNRPKP